MYIYIYIYIHIYIQYANDDSQHHQHACAHGVNDIDVGTGCMYIPKNTQKICVSR